MSPVLGKAASCGDNIIKVHDLSDMREVYDVITLEEERALDKLVKARNEEIKIKRKIKRKRGKERMKEEML